MNIFLESLIDPIAYELEKQSEKFIEPFPDKFRPYIFNIFNFDIEKKIENLEMFHQSAKLPKKYLKFGNEQLIKIFIKLVKKFPKIKKHSFTNYLLGKENLDENILKYYHKVYDFMDLIIVKTIYHKNNSLLFDCINELFSSGFDSKNIIYFRIIIYFAVYFIKIKLVDKFHQVTIEKIKEFQMESKITKFFLKKELKNYLKYLNF